MASQMDLKLVPYELAEGMEQTKHLIESVEPGQQIAILSVRKAALTQRRSGPPQRPESNPLRWERGFFVQRQPDLRLSHG